MEGRPYFKCIIEDNGDVWVSDGRGGRVKEIYDHYLSPLAETEQADDTVKLARVQQPFFIQLCVQASKARDLDQKPFHELLEKIKNGTIDSGACLVMMTKKDQVHRLLSYIPTGKVHCLVNNKKVELLFSGFETEEDKIYNAPLREAYQKHKSETAKDEEGASDIMITRGYRPPFTPKYSGSEIASTFSYDFAADKEHHAKVVAEFNALLKKS